MRGLPYITVVIKWIITKFFMNRELLQRYVEGDISDGDAARVVEWLDGDQSRVDEYLVLHKLHDITVLHATEAPALAGKRTKLRKVGIEIAKIAAVIVAVIAVGRLIPSTDVPPTEPVAMQTLYVPAGQRARVDLPDGTKVWVNAQSTLIYPVDFGRDSGRREVTLDGEALFDVEADEQRPFYVNTPAMKVEVTGTEFNVLAYSSSAVSHIALLEGKAALYTPDGGELLYTMNPADHVILSENDLRVSPIMNYDYFRWSEGLICFSNETVREIFDKLELYFDTTIDVEREGMLDFRYTGKFRTKDGIEQVLKTIQLEHRFRYEKDTPNNRITIK